MQPWTKHTRKISLEALCHLYTQMSTGGSRGIPCANSAVILSGELIIQGSTTTCHCVVMLCNMPCVWIS